MPGWRTSAAPSHRAGKALGLLGAAAGFWALFVGLASLYAVLVAGYRYQAQNLGFDAALVLQGALFAVAIRTALERLTGHVFWKQLLVTAALLLVCAPVFETVFRIANGFVRPGGPPDLSMAKILGASLFWLAPLGLWSAINLALLHDAEARRRERRLGEVRAQAQEAQILALRYQVNPHFLYNALNSIATLILDARNADAEEMVLRLSDFLRASLANDPLVDVRLADEIALQRLYLAVEQVRLADMFAAEIDLPPALEDAHVPSLILQPLVENVVKHAIRGEGHMTTLRISARREADRLVLRVEDDGPGISPRAGGSGVGLANVERRLAARFGTQAAFEAVGGPAGFKVRLAMPLEGN